MKVEFSNAQGEILSGHLELPGDKVSCFAVFAHCFTCSKDVFAASRISRELCARGVGVLRFDFTGLGESDGDFSDTNFSTQVSDLLAASQFLGQNYQAPAIMVGHSLGGAAVLSVSSQIESVKAVATIAAPKEAKHVAHLLKDSIESIANEGEAEVQLAGRSFTIKKQFIDDVQATRLRPQIAELALKGIALMVFHSPADKIVSIDHAKEIYLSAGQPKSFVSIDGADHLLTKARDAEFVASMIATWASRYID